MKETAEDIAPSAGPGLWQARDIRAEDYRIVLDAECRAEIRAAAGELRTYPLPTIVLDPGDFAMPACRGAMARARACLDEGVRFALVDRLPVDELNAAEATQAYWLLAAMIARPVAQKLDGTLVYDVLDTGRQARPGSGVRPDQTSIEIRFHNDNSYNASPPDYVGLLCINRAKSGGLSRVLSFQTVHNRLLALNPAALRRLYEPFWFDRQREYAPGESPVFAAPVFDRGPELRARFSAHQIGGGSALRGIPLDAEGEAAVAAMLELFADETLIVDFDLEPGQMQFVHNRAIGHSRTAFEDHPAPEERRHLVRLWLRDHGRRAYPG